MAVTCLRGHSCLVRIRSNAVSLNFESRLFHDEHVDDRCSGGDAGVASCYMVWNDVDKSAEMTLFDPLLMPQ